MRLQLKLCRLVCACGLLVFVIASFAHAQGPYVYPARGQSPEQQNRDQYECHNWAVSQTGVNPTAAAAAPPQGGAMRGAARGAAVGAVGGQLRAMRAKERRLGRPLVVYLVAYARQIRGHSSRMPMRPTSRPCGPA
jgi:hypothetical protein